MTFCIRTRGTKTGFEVTVDGGDNGRVTRYFAQAEFTMVEAFVEGVKAAAAINGDFVTSG